MPVYGGFGRRWGCWGRGVKQVAILIGIILAVGTCPEAIGQVQPLKLLPLEKAPREDRPSEPPSEEEFTFVILVPQLIGGEKSIRQSFRYPREAREQGIKGEVVVSFVVNEEGGVEDVVVDQSIGGGCDEEAMRVVREARFTPGREVRPSSAGNIYGEPVKVRMSLSVRCRPPLFRRLFD